MPDTFAAISVCRFAIESTTPSGLHVNVLHFVKQDESPFTADDMQDLGNNFENLNDGMFHYLGWMPTTCTLNQIRMSQVQGVERAGLVYPVNQTGDRVVATDSLPGQLCTVVSWRTGLIGRRFRGRSYLGMMYEGDQAAGLELTARGTPVQTWLNTMISNFSLTGSQPYIMCILSDPGDNLPNDAVPAGVPIPLAAAVTTYSYSDMIYTQRRRRITHGL